MSMDTRLLPLLVLPIWLDKIGRRMSSSKRRNYVRDCEDDTDTMRAKVSQVEHQVADRWLMVDGRLGQAGQLIGLNESVDAVASERMSLLLLLLCPHQLRSTI